jgi:hypothetical protein
MDNAAADRAVPPDRHMAKRAVQLPRIEAIIGGDQTSLDHRLARHRAGLVVKSLGHRVAGIRGTKSVIGKPVSGCGGDDERVHGESHSKKRFFFEKKNQKTFPLGARSNRRI